MLSFFGLDHGRGSISARYTWWCAIGHSWSILLVFFTAFKTFLDGLEHLSQGSQYQAVEALCVGWGGDNSYSELVYLATPATYIFVFMLLL